MENLQQEIVNYIQLFNNEFLNEIFQRLLISKISNKILFRVVYYC